jgi:hypothetical protein
MITNIVDRRKRPHRWKRVNAIIEATWHDNSCTDANQADPEPEYDLDYCERENVSVTQAIEWASKQEAEVTLFLYDQGEGTARAGTRQLK